MFKPYEKSNKIVFLHIKMTNYYQILKERLKKEVRRKYQNLSEEEKNKSWIKAYERYKNFIEE